MTVRTVSLVISELPRGGTETQVRLLAQGLRDRGVDVEVLVLYGGGAVADELLVDSIPVVALGLGSRHDSDTGATAPALAGTAARAPIAATRLVRHLRARRPDVVHCFLYRSYVTVPPLARLAGVPGIVTGRRRLADYKTGRRIALLAERAADRFVGAIVANSNAVAADTIRTEAVDPARVHVIGNALDPAMFERVTPATDVAPLLVAVGNIKPEKDHATLVRAAALVRAAGVPVSVAVVGGDRMAGTLQSLAATNGVPLITPGAVADVRPWLAAASVYVHPSVSEGMPNAVAEAMAQGCPIVATAVGGTPDVVGDAGLLIPAGDPRAMADALLEVLTDTDGARALGRQARLRAKDEFGIDRLAGAHVALYERLASRGVSSA